MAQVIILASEAERAHGVLTRALQSARLNFLLGSGASVPRFLSPGKWSRMSLAPSPNTMTPRPIARYPVFSSRSRILPTLDPEHASTGKRGNCC